MLPSESHKSIQNMSNLCYSFFCDFDIMMACPTCSKRLQCHNCVNTYHMKYIPLETDYISQWKVNHENCFCGSCITDTFLFNKLENENDFRQAILMKLENKLIISNLIYNPHESNSLDWFIVTNLIRMQTVSDKEIYFQDKHAHITQEIV